MDNFLAQLTATTWLEGIAVVLALAYVWLAARQNIWCWPCALVSTGIYTWLFWHVSLPFHTALNVYFMIMAIYGWLQWKNKFVTSNSVQTWPLNRHLFCISFLVLAAWALSQFAVSVLDTSNLYLDAFITVFSVFTTILVAHKVTENWLYWIVINSFAAYLFFTKDLALTAVLYVCYVGFALYGYIQWQKDAQLIEKHL
jgi:nicotinamide mononucleotide transporter